MIHSLVGDAVWLERFAQLPVWQPVLLPTLVVAPHPDDETLGAGALIYTLRQRGVPVTVVAVTDGENCYDYPPAEREAMGRLREQEQAAALGHLGVAEDNIARLRLTDSGLHHEEEALTELLGGLAAPGMQIVAPWSGDFHPDHEACARAAARVAAAKGLPLVSYFFWTWHRGEPELLGDLPVARFQPDAAALQAKQVALAEHRSQLQCERFEAILPERLVGPAHWPFEVFLPA